MNLNTAQRLALNLDSHIVIDAGAGTGKTSTIIDRVIEHYLTEDQRATRILPQPERPSRLEGGLLLSPVSETIDLRKWGGLLPGEVVLLTFTNRASDEMRDRLRNRISRLKPGPISDDGINRTDPRIRHTGFNEQLLTLLEDAPIGTIDSFFNQLISPYKGYLGDSFSSEVVSDSSRILLIESALNTLWKLPNSFNLLGDAVDAGIPSEIATEVLNARDNIAKHYSGRRTAGSILRSLVHKSIFIQEGSRMMIDKEGKIDPNLLCERIIESIDISDISYFTDNINLHITQFCDFIKENVNVLAPDGVFSDTRIATLEYLANNGPPSGKWDKLIWLSHIYLTITSEATLMSDKPVIFPSNKLPSNSWEKGIKNYSEIKNKNTKKLVIDGIKEIIKSIKDMWATKEGKFILHYTQIILILDNSQPPLVSNDWQHPLSSLPFPLPERLHSGQKVSKYHFTLDAEVKNLNDLRLIHDGFLGILNKLKENEEKHDYEDVQRLTGDLLLANCPDICRYFYPPLIQEALDSLGSDTWRDDHISKAFTILENMEKTPESAGNSFHNLSAIRMDLSQRYDLLKRIRRRYRAFIIDEAQDNSPLQWRLLSRLWGERHSEEGEVRIPDTPWQPTICYVGDVKQSIYAFRQAEVTGFLQYSNILRTINNHELTSIEELTRSPALRRENASRDPRNSYNLSIAKANLVAKDGGRNLIPWIPFDLSDVHIPSPSTEEVNARKEGLIRLQVNYRTDGGLLRVMNHWWNDIFNIKHRNIPNGDFYANPQPLYPSRDKINIQGSLEWICPVNTGGNFNPETDLRLPLDPFGPGKPDSIERQSMMIAQRVRNLIEGKPVKVQSPDGKWIELPAEEPVEPSEIMILLPSRSKIRDVIIRYLHDYNIPAQADREGGLLDRPAAHTIEGLLQFIARPTSRHHASWLARSTLIGLNDEKLQEFIHNSLKGEDLLLRLLNFAVNERQKKLIQRWIFLSSSGRIIDLLEETVDRSDILIAYPDLVSRQDIEQIIAVIRSLSKEVGGDPIVLADKIRNLRESSGNTLEAVTIPPTDAVRVMTIHGSKGLQSKVVILADIFSGRQTNMTMDDKSRLIVGPELFAGNPRPWSNQLSPISALWKHVRKIHKARKSAESRRLLYVGATRAENKLIIVGSTKETSWIPDVGINLPWTYNNSLPQLGEMWIESLRQGSGNRGENNSPWMDSSDISLENLPILSKGIRILDPSIIINNGFLGDSGGLEGMAIFQHPNCFDTSTSKQPTISTPLIKIEEIHKNAMNSTNRIIPNFSMPRDDSFIRLKIAPSKISILEKCPRRYWLETHGGLSSMPTVNLEEDKSSKGLPKGIDAASFGTIVHRIIEIGIGNPGPTGLYPTTPLPKSWIQKTPDTTHEKNVHDTVFDELLPTNADKNSIEKLVNKMIHTLKSGPLGILSAGKSFDGHVVEGLRTEMPFNIIKKIKSPNLIRTQWTPDGLEPLSKVEYAEFEMDGLIDLVLCTISEQKSFIRPVDLKTEEARKLITGEKNGLLEALSVEGTTPICEAEMNILLEHRMQQALYFRALQSIEEEREKFGYPSRQVLPPAILIGVTGRFVIYPEDMLNNALNDLDDNLIIASRMALESQINISDYICKCNECPK